MRAHLNKPFSEFHFCVGDETIPIFNDSRIMLPKHLIIPFIDDQSSLDTLIKSVFSDLTVFGPNLLLTVNKVILTTRNDFVHEINNVLISQFPSLQHTYFSHDETVDISKQAEHEDFLHSLELPTLPPHELILKVNSPVILLRNPREGLYNGTRLICLAFNGNVIHAMIAVGNHTGKEVFIPKISLQCSDPHVYTISFKRTQFPLKLYFVVTINKA
ncbi:uncharacterized protein [Coffea arabica]|uniref:DNA helicase Pif1-like 2B domain-containing protein n=1 Tax=Coffea arabica TaxID=13443 RepID=A0A6P6TBK4_COFAR|nr:uncharacterized protein LOC113699650 [Coffea arabica]